MASLSSSVAIQVPVSQPAHSGPSLLRLPSEIRNKIYHLALVAPKPIVYIIGLSEDPYQLPKRPGEYKPVGPPCYLDADARVAVATSLALARSCKQIRGECIGIFYSENVFELATPAGYHTPPLLWQIPHAVAWSRSWSPLACKYLRKIVLNVDGTCPGVCQIDNTTRHHGPGGLFCILLLVEEMWRRDDGRCIFQFEFPKGPAHQEAVARLKALGLPDSMAFDFHANVMNGLLESLVKDTLKLKRYGKQLLQIVVCPVPDTSKALGWPRNTFGYLGEAIFGRPCQKREEWDANFGRYFTIKNEGKTLRFEDLQPIRDLLSLPKMIKREIVRYALLPSGDEPFFFDLHTGEHSKIEKGAFTVFGRESFLVGDVGIVGVQGLFWNSCAFIYKMTAFSARTTFENFEKLKKRFRLTGSIEYPWITQFHGFSKPLTIEMRFTLQEQSHLQDLRIGIMEFLRITNFAKNTGTTVKFTTAGGTSNVTSAESWSTSLYAVRAHVLELLSQVHILHGTNSTNFEVYIDGTGQAREVVYTDGETPVVYHATQVSNKEPSIEGVAARYRIKHEMLKTTGQDCYYRNSGNNASVALHLEWLDLIVGRRSSSAATGYTRDSTA